MCSWVETDGGKVSWGVHTRQEPGHGLWLGLRVCLGKPLKGWLTAPRQAGAELYCLIRMAPTREPSLRGQAMLLC